MGNAQTTPKSPPRKSKFTWLRGRVVNENISKTRALHDSLTALDNQLQQLIAAQKARNAASQSARTQNPVPSPPSNPVDVDHPCGVSESHGQISHASPSTEGRTISSSLWDSEAALKRLGVVMDDPEMQRQVEVDGRRGGARESRWVEDLEDVKGNGREERGKGENLKGKGKEKSEAEGKDKFTTNRERRRIERRY